MCEDKQLGGKSLQIDEVPELSDSERSTKNYDPSHSITIKIWMLKEEPLEKLIN